MLKVITELEKLGLELTDEQKESIKKSFGEEVYSKRELDKDAVDAAVKDLKFSSNSAKKAFVSDLMSDKLKMKNEVTVTSNATFGMTGMIYFDTPQVNQANPFTCAYMGTENNRQFFAGIMWTKTKNTVTLDYEDVEPGVFLYDILPNDDGTTELE